MISKIHHIYQRSICLLICYFGKFPWYFNYFLHSCSYNFSIDFFIITDQNISSENLPSNVFIIHKTISDVNKIASKKLDLKINIQNPYKLCDFKPAYGFLFPEIINGYDFWGHGDIDIIFGDIRFFITDELLNNYDSISVPHDFVTGYFQLFRNNKKMNTLFMKKQRLQKSLY